MRELEIKDNTASSEVVTDFEARKKSLYERISTIEIALSEKISPYPGASTTSPWRTRASTMMDKQKPLSSRASY